MRIITTFNDRLFEASGCELLQSIQHYLPNAELLVYHELDQYQLDAPSIDIRSLPELDIVRERQRDVLSPDFGGTADHLTGFNRRWFGWFHKIVAQHDALVRRPSGGLTMFLDCDIRVMKSFGAADVLKTFKKPVGVMRGTREAVETGVIAFDESSPGAAEFVQQVMDLYLSGRFRNLPRWDDSYAYRDCSEHSPHLIEDVAHGQKPIEHTNTNGHTTTGQILPLTPWAPFFEHDKGLHWRSGAVPDIRPANAAELKWPGRLRSLVSRILPG